MASDRPFSPFSPPGAVMTDAPCRYESVQDVTSPVETIEVGVFDLKHGVRHVATLHAELPLTIPPTFVDERSSRDLCKPRFGNMEAFKGVPYIATIDVSSGRGSETLAGRFEPPLPPNCYPADDPYHGLLDPRGAWALPALPDVNVQPILVAEAFRLADQMRELATDRPRLIRFTSDVHGAGEMILKLLDALGERRKDT